LERLAASVVAAEAIVYVAAVAPLTAKRFAKKKKRPLASKRRSKSKHYQTA
jgi:hypothetical protein